MGIASWVLFYTGSSTLLYFIQAELVNAAFQSRDARTSFFGSVDLAMNSLALLIQATLTGRLMSRLGVSLTLMILPVTTLLGFAALWVTHQSVPDGALLWGLAPLVWVFVMVRVVRSGSHYALAKPAKEVLFTVVSRAEKYKAKVFIDTAVYRGGDVAAAWVLEALRRIAGLMALTAAGIPLAVGWMGLAWWLGRAQRKRAMQPEPPPARGFEVIGDSRAA
jgi:AAA family ATP:ADP antiporter